MPTLVEYLAAIKPMVQAYQAIVTNVVDNWDTTTTIEKFSAFNDTNPALDIIKGQLSLIAFLESQQ